MRCREDAGACSQIKRVEHLRLCRQVNLHSELGPFARWIREFPGGHLGGYDARVGGCALCDPHAQVLKFAKFDFRGQYMEGCFHTRG